MKKLELMLEYETEHNGFVPTGMCSAWNDWLMNELLSTRDIINKLQRFAIEHDINMRDCKDIAEVYIKYVENKKFEETELPPEKTFDENVALLSDNIQQTHSIICGNYPVICNFQVGHSGKFCSYKEHCSHKKQNA